MTLLTVSDIVLLYGTGLLILLITFVGAHFLFRPSAAARALVASAVLFLFLLCTYAVINTAANTVFSLGFVLVLLVLARLRGNKTGITIPVKVMAKQFLLFAVSYTSVFAVYFFLYGYLDCAFPYLGDNGVYARIAAYIRDTGIETNRLDPELVQLAMPYHYLELHAAALLSQLSGINTTYTLLIGTTSLLLTYILGVFYAISSKIFAGNKLFPTIMMAVAGLFLSGYIFPFYQSIPFTADLKIFTYNVFELKFMGVYFAFALAAYYCLEREWLSSYISLLLVSVVTIVAAPAVFGLGFFILLLILIQNQFSRNIFYAFAATFLGAGLFLVVFYKYINGFEQGNSLVGDAPFADLYSVDQLLLMLRILIGGTLKLLLTFALPIILVFSLLLIRYRTLKNLWFALYDYRAFLLFSFLLIVGSCTVWAIMNQMIDSIQFFILPALAALQIILFVFLLLAVKDNARLERMVSFLAVTAVAVVVGRVWQTNEQYSSACLDYLALKDAVSNCMAHEQATPGRKNQQPVVFFNKSLQPRTSIFVKNLTVYGLGQNYLLYFTDKPLYVPINILDMPLHPDDSRAQAVERFFERSSFLGRYLEREESGASRKEGITAYLQQVKPDLYITDVADDHYLGYFPNARLVYEVQQLKFYCVD